MGTITLADALNTPANINKTIRTSADQPIEYTDVVWDDETFPFTQTRRGVNQKPEMDTNEVALRFERNAAADKLYINCQFKHKRKLGATVHPHIHWIQKEEALPTWKIDYRWLINGAAVPATFTPGIEPDTYEAFTYESGNLAQISKWEAIAPPDDDNVSATLQIKLYRDDNAGPEIALGVEFDIHFQIDTPGSKQEYVK